MQTNGATTSPTFRIAHILETFRRELAPKVKCGTETSTIYRIDNGSGLGKTPVKAQAQILEAQRDLQNLGILLEDTFKGGSLTQTIQVTQNGLDIFGKLSKVEKRANQERGITNFPHVTQSRYGSFLLHTDTGLDIEGKKLVTNISVVKLGEDGVVKDFTLPELRKLQSYAISITAEGATSQPVTLDLPVEENYFASAGLSLPVDQISPEKMYSVQVKLTPKVVSSAPIITNGEPSEVTSSGSVASVAPVKATGVAGLKDLRNLVEEVFLKKGPVNQELKDTLSDLGDLIRTKTYNEDAVFRKQLGNYEVTVKGQRPKTPGKNVVLVVDFDKVDSSKFTDAEKDLLRNYPIQLHYEDASSTGDLQDAWSPEVVLSEREDSMSAGFWAEYRGQGINLKLYYDRFKEEKEWIRYESEIARVQTPANVQNPNKIVLNLQTS